MKPIRKPFSSEPLFPFELVYKDTKSPERELPDHLHDRYEFVYVYEGRGTFFIDRKLYAMKAGDLFLIPGNSIHRALPDAETPVTSTAVFFAPSLASHETVDEPYNSLRCFELARKRKHYLLELSDALQAETVDALEAMRLELEHRGTGYRHAIVLRFQLWLLGLNRHMIETRPEGRTESGIGPQWMKDVLDHIAAHPADDLSLATLARRSSVTGAHFSRVFKQLTGMNLTDYVNAKRISIAKEQLLETDDNVSLIAERCGFDSLPYFHRLFKKYTNRTPAAYKKRQS